MPVTYKNSIKIKDLEANPDSLYLYCENAEYQNDGKFTLIKGEENAVGVRLKFSPGNLEASHINEGDSFEGMAMIDEDLEQVFEHVKSGGTVVIPKMDFIPSKLCESVRAYFLAQLSDLSNL